MKQHITLLIFAILILKYGTCLEIPIPRIGEDLFNKRFNKIKIKIL